MSAVKVARPCPARGNVHPSRMEPSAAVIEALYRKASLLRHGLYSLYTEAKENGEPLFADEDVFPLWEVAGELLVGLRELNEAGR